MGSHTPLPPWPAIAPAMGRVTLRAVRGTDSAMARALSADPYVPTIGTLPWRASEEQAQSWVRHQQSRHGTGRGFSFTIVETSTDRPVGHCGLWLGELAEGRAAAGYAIIPAARGRGLAADALGALTAFGWSIPGLFRIALHVEPWNIASLRTAERAGYAREGLLRSHQQIAGRRRDMVLLAAIRPADPTRSAT